MSEPARHRLTVEQFYGWVQGLDARYELVDGAPVLMAGANRRHDRVVINATYARAGANFAQQRASTCFQGNRANAVTRQLKRKNEPRRVENIH
jgi:hypothetical protein